MLPQSLSEWSVDVVLTLLRTAMFESELFDYKEALPHPKDESGKDRLRRACCAFANSSGGFLVFGISDDKAKSPEDRLVGLESLLDFPEKFGNYPHTCTPAIAWNFLNPPLTLSNGRVLHIVHVPKSWNGPHAQGEPSSGWRFPKRTNKGDEDMSMEEIRSGFLGYYEKRLKLQLLRSELAALKEVAGQACVKDQTQIASHYSLDSFDTQVIESIIADTYSITASAPNLLKLLAQIRQAARVANNTIRIFFGKVQLPLSNMAVQVREHNEFMRPKCENIINLCEGAIKELDRLLGSV